MKTTHIDSGGNVFADLGFPDAETRLIKAKLVMALEQAMHDRGASPTQVAALLNLDPTSFDAIFDGHFDSVSTDDLLRALTALDNDVQIIVGPKAEEHARGRVTVIGAPAT